MAGTSGSTATAGTEATVRGAGDCAVGAHAITPVILSGGAGTRLWPLSRTSHPKQFQALAPDGETLLAATIKRNAPLSDTPPLVISHADHRFLVAEELRIQSLDQSRIILEPEGRNTAPAALVAALAVARRRPDGLVLLTPSDHAVTDGDAYRQTVAAAAEAAHSGAIVTFGIVPTRPDTGFGYLRRSNRVCLGAAYWLEAFVEKPDAATAGRFLAEGSYLWNSGIFLFRADRLLAEAARLAPEVLAACTAALDGARDDHPFVWLDPVAFGRCPAGALDTVIMEKTDQAAVVPMAAGWNDVGSWQSLWEIGDKDGGGNVTVGDVVTKDTRGSYLWSSDTLVAALGVEDLIVVATADAVLVCPRSRCQDVKQLVEDLNRRRRTESVSHVLVRRPWGAYESLGRGDRFQVKRLIVNPGKRLSVQLHHHRSEHWVVVRGTARILNGERETLLFENQSTYIAAGTRHRLENPGLIPLELIEVQSGSYLGEDDIVRFDDDFGRA